MKTSERTANISWRAAMAAMILTGAAMAATVYAKPALSAETQLTAALPMSFADVVERVSPAVVNIQVTSRSKPAFGPMDRVPGNMQEFFQHHNGAPNGGNRGPARVGAGSGFVIDADGHIVTNEHVIRGADEITVTFQDGRIAVAKLVGQDAKTDLALLKIDSDGDIPFVSFGQSDKVRVGDWVVTVGNPFGLGHSVNVGIVSARGRTIGAGPYDDFLQIDAAINRGNSGGPAFDVHGNVVGVNAAIFSPNGGNVGIGFAIPSELAQGIIQDLKSKGVVERGWLGVSIQPITPDIADSLGIEANKGVLVAEVRGNGPAKRAGLRTGDVILQVDGTLIDKSPGLPRVIADINPGTKTDIVLLREGQERTIAVEIGRQPDARVAAVSPANDSSEADFGLALKDLDRETARTLNLPDNATGVIVVAVDPNSPAAKKGLRSGDVLTQVDGRAIKGKSDVNDVIRAAKAAGKKSLLTLVVRGTGQRFVAIPLRTA